MQRGDSETEEAAARQLAIAAGRAARGALAEQATATDQRDRRLRQAVRQAATRTIAKKQAALQKLEQEHADEITAAEAAENAADRALGADYLAGATHGRGADPRAVAALQFALAQRGDPYVWSEEGPDQYDCSGLMFAAYRTPRPAITRCTRVSRDQYWQTRSKTVDRYSLLPGDLLFFSSSSSWQGIHHVAMYAGNGMMVEAPRTGLDVRLVPVRWTRLFRPPGSTARWTVATQGPDLSQPTARDPAAHHDSADHQAADQAQRRRRPRRHLRRPVRTAVEPPSDPPSDPPSGDPSAPPTTGTPDPDDSSATPGGSPSGTSPSGRRPRVIAHRVSRSSGSVAHRVIAHRVDRPTGSSPTGSSPSGSSRQSDGFGVQIDLAIGVGRNVVGTVGVGVRGHGVTQGRSSRASGPTPGARTRADVAR